MGDDGLIRASNPQPIDGVSSAFFVKRDGLEHYEPFQATSPWAAVGPAYAIWQLTPWTVIQDPLPTDFVITHLCVKAVVIPFLAGVLAPGIMQLQLAEANPGGGGETNIMETALSSSSIITTIDGVNLLSGSFMLPMGPRLVRSGRRLCFRIASSVPGATAQIAVAVYAVGYNSATPPGYPLYSYGRRMEGMYPNSYMRVWPVLGSQAITTGLWPAYSAWISVIDPAPTDLLVWGVSDYGGDLFSFGREYQVGAGPSGGGGEVPLARALCPEYAVLDNSAGWLWRPALIKRGERLSIRAGAPGGINLYFNVHYEEI